jgi:hypothetical protein
MEALVIPLVLALMIAVKQIPIFAPDPADPEGGRMNGWLLPWVSAALGVGGVMLYAEAFGGDAGNMGAKILNGIIYGLAASGLWSGGAGQAVKGVASAMKPMAWLILLLPMAAMAGGCQEALVIRQSDAWIGTGIKTYAANNREVFDGWAEIYGMAREADANYTTQKVIDKLKTMNLTPEKMEIEVKSLIAHRDKVKTDTAGVIKKMREAQAKNDAELAKVLVLKGKVSEWMEAGMTTEAIPAITQEVVNLVRTFYPETPAPAP